MKKRAFNIKSILFGTVLTGSLAVNPLASMADNMGANATDDAFISCGNAANVMDCINQTQNPNVRSANLSASSLPLNSQTFGLTGPVSLNVRYDSDLKWIIDGAYAEQFGKYAAGALKVSAGPNEYRGNGTIGFNITPKQQIKLTYEYLMQNLPFDYTAGTINEWVSQNAYGAAYRYLLGNSILQSLELSGSYTKANSKELKDVYVYDPNGNVTDVDYRRIAGGQQTTGMASVVLTPMKNTLLKVGAGYSASSFDTQWASNQATSTIAYNVEASHLVTPKTLVSASVNNTATNQAHTVKVSQILPGNLEGNVTGQYNVSHVDGMANNGNVTVGLSYPAPKTYSNLFSGGIGDLKAWVQQPVIYNTRVLAIAEELVTKVGIQTSPMPTQNIPVNTTMTSLSTKAYFTFDPRSYDRIDYSIQSITDKNNNAVNVDLKIKIQNDDAYTATISSTGPMPAAAFTPPGSQYVIHLLAQGYHHGQAQPLTIAQNQMEVDVQPNEQLDAAKWATNPPPTLPVATPDQKYDSGSLNAFVKGITGETFTYTITQRTNANWINVDNDHPDHLIGTPNSSNNNLGEDTVIKVNANSNISHKDATPGAQQFTIVISKAFTMPNWSTTKLPAATQGLAYGNSGATIFLNPYAPQNSLYVTKTYVNGSNQPTDTLKFVLAEPKNGNKCDWLHLDNDSASATGQLIGTPSTGVVYPNNKCTFAVDVYSTLGQGDPKNPAHLEQDITVNSIGYVPPAWQLDLPNASTGKAYLDAAHNDVVLSPYSSNTKSQQYLSKTKYATNPPQDINDDKLTFAWNNDQNQLICYDSKGAPITNGGTWMTLSTNDNNGSLSGTVPLDNIIDKCVANIKVFSEKMQQWTSLPDKIIQIDSTAPIWKGPQTVAINYLNPDTYQVKLSDGIQSPTGYEQYENVQFNPHNLKSGGINGTVNYQGNPGDPNRIAFLTVKPTLADVVDVSNNVNNFDSQSDLVGSLTVNAFNGAKSDKSTSTGSFRVIVQAPLTAPANQTNNSNPVPITIMATQSGSFTIDPYKAIDQYPNGQYLKPIYIQGQETAASVTDTWTITGKPGTDNPCTKYSVSDGILSIDTSSDLGNSCNAQINIHSDKRNADTILTIPVVLTPRYAAPQWTDKDLPRGTSGQAYTDDQGHNIQLSPAVSQTYVKKTQDKKNNSDAEDTYSNFKWTNNELSCYDKHHNWLDGSWLSLDNNTGELSGKIPLDKGISSCDLLVSLTSGKLGTVNLDKKTIYIDSTAPNWNNPSNIEVPYTDDGKGSGVPYNIVLKNSIQSPTGAEKFQNLVVNTDLPALSIGKAIQPNGSDPNAYVVVAPQLKDVVNKGNTTGFALGKFSVDAYYGQTSDPSNTATGNFNVQVTATLTPAKLSANPQFKINTLGDTGNFPLNPYNTTDGTFVGNNNMDPTVIQETGNIVPDTLAFTNDATQPATVCKNYTISSNGLTVVTKANDGSLIQTDDCDVNLVMTSAKMGNTLTAAASKLPIHVTVGAPAKWATPTIAGQTIKFDDMATGIDLKSFYDANTSSGGLQLTIEDGTTKKANWEITPDNRLIRKISDGKIDATDVTGTDDQVVKIKIVNNKNPAGDVATFKITVLPDPDKVKFVWVGTGAQKNFVFTGGQNSIPLGPNLQTPSLQTQLNDGTVINDSWSNVTGINNDNVVFKTPTDANMTIASSNNSYSITIPSAAFDTSGQNLGTYPNSSRSQDPTKMMLNVTAASIGSAKTLNLASADTNNGGVQNGGVTVTIGGTLGWTSQSQAPTRKFDAVINDTNADTVGVDLNPYFAADPSKNNLAGFDINFDDTKSKESGNWKIIFIKNSGHFYLGRRINNSGLDITDVAQGAPMPIMTQSATTANITANNSPVGYKINITPNSNLSIKWYIQGTGDGSGLSDTLYWLPSDKGGKNKAYGLGNLDNGNYQKGMTLRTCVDPSLDPNCSMQIKGDTIYWNTSLTRRLPVKNCNWLTNNVVVNFQKNTGTGGNQQWDFYVETSQDKISSGTFENDCKDVQFKLDSEMKIWSKATGDPKSNYQEITMNIKPCSQSTSPNNRSCTVDNDPMI